MKKRGGKFRTINGILANHVTLKLKLDLLWNVSRYYETSYFKFWVRFFLYLYFIMWSALFALIKLAYFFVFSYKQKIVNRKFIWDDESKTYQKLYKIWNKTPRINNPDWRTLIGWYSWYYFCARISCNRLVVFYFVFGGSVSEK